MGLVGFGEGDSTLGGSVRLNDVIALRVKALQPIYLKGAGKDFYTGWAWINTDTQPLPIQDPNNRLNVDLYEMTEGSKLLTEEEDFLSRYFTEDRVQITYENLKLKSLFTPLKVKTIEPLQQVVVDSSGGASSIKLLRKNDSYAIETYYVRHSSEELQEILRRSRKGLYEEALGGGEGTRLTEEELIVLHSIAKNIYGKYVQLPDTVPSEVYELARSITEGYDTTYDKVRAVERYMYNNYTYTLTPDPLPEEGDFSAHFLLDSKKGYCTYYATGMAVLLRSLDIPTRYVEGYMIPPSLQKTGSEYIVTNERAHAWVECYFEGFGWLSFDPTFYRESTYRSYTGEATGMYEEYYESLYEQQMQQSFDWMEGEFWADRGAESLKSYGDMAGYILGGIFVILLFVQSLRQSWKLQWYQQKKKRVYIQKIYEKYLKMLALQELQMADGETPLEYAMRINPYVNDHSIDLIKTTEIFLRARYSTMEISPEDFRQMGDFYLHLRRKTKQNTNRVVYWMYRCILGTI